MTIALDSIQGMPAFCTYFPMPPARYRNARFQYVYFRADRSAIDRVLPACFEPSDDGFCAAFGLTVPWSSNYGPFDESGLIVKCKYQGIDGYFSPVVFLNSRSSIPAGREIYGTPKVFAQLTVGMDERVMFTETRITDISLLSVRSTMHREARPDEMYRLQPSWRLKVVPRADGQGVDVMQIIDVSRVTSDVVVHVCRSGDGVVQFNPAPIYDLSDFQPREYLGANYLEMDFTEGYGEIVHDFLRKDA